MYSIYGEEGANALYVIANHLIPVKVYRHAVGIFAGYIHLFLFLVLWNYYPWVLDATALVAKSTYERILRKLLQIFRLAKFLLRKRMLLTTIYIFVIIVHKIVCNSGNILSTFWGVTKV